MKVYKIFIVDDFSYKLESFISYIKSYNNIVEVANSYLKAEEILFTNLNKFDIIVLDLRMVYGEEENAGILFCQKILSLDLKIPILLFTVLDEKNDFRIKDLINNSSVFYLQKGVTVNYFYDYIIKILNQ
jgi:response regulator RpfG family c-di-GMP phosphodiesterase